MGIMDKKEFAKRFEEVLKDYPPRSRFDGRGKPRGKKGNWAASKQPVTQSNGQFSTEKGPYGGFVLRKPRS